MTLQTSRSIMFSLLHNKLSRRFKRIKSLIDNFFQGILIWIQTNQVWIRVMSWWTHSKKIKMDLWGCTMARNQCLSRETQGLLTSQITSFRVDRREMITQATPCRCHRLKATNLGMRDTILTNIWYKSNMFQICILRFDSLSHLKLNWPKCLLYLLQEHSVQMIHYQAGFSWTMFFIRYKTRLRALSRKSQLTFLRQQGQEKALAREDQSHLWSRKTKIIASISSFRKQWEYHLINIGKHKSIDLIKLKKHQTRIIVWKG